MSQRKKIWSIFIGILILVSLAGLVDYPHLPNWIPGNEWLSEKNVRLGLDLKGGAHLVYEADMSQIEEADREDSLSGVRDVIEKRVDAFGVAEPVVQTNRTNEHYRVIIELPGVQDVNEAIDMIGDTPILEFKTQTEEPPKPLTDKEREQQQKEIDEYNKIAKERAEEVLAKISSGEDFMELAREYSEDPGSKDKGGDLDWFGRGMMITEFEDATFALSQNEITSELVDSLFGYHIIQKTGERTVEKEDGSVEEVRASHILFAKKSDMTENRPTITWANTELTGKQLQNARIQFNQQFQTPEVGLVFNDEGTKLFAELTKNNIGRQIAIFLDGYIISAPTVNEEIPSGEAVISGGFTLIEAKELAMRLNAGALPVPIELVNQTTVGATLGKVSVQRSFLAGMFGLLLVCIFMIVFYRLPGVLAVIALGFYAVIILAIFKLLSVTLTLAGVAGFILSIGMAVDANVLIFERFKEELRSGKDIQSAIEEGFAQAWSSIRDSNVSSLITCLILSWFGTSIIKGFAITLAIGILLSMFSAIIITKTLLRLVVTQKIDKNKWLLGVSKR